MQVRLGIRDIQKGKQLKKYSHKALCFDDILMVPQQTSVQSRRTVDVSTTIGVQHRAEASIYLSSPIISAPMDTVTGPDTAVALASSGGLGIMHRYNSPEQRIEDAINAGFRPFGVSVSTIEAMNESFLSEIVDAGAAVICVDTANGHNSMALEAVSFIRQHVPSYIHIMSGNVATSEGFKALIDAGSDSVRVGIGGGSACTTRIVSGHGMPTLASIMDCSEMYPELRSAIIADGGIRNSGDIVKSVAAGASAVMLGNLLAGHNESPGQPSGDRVYFRGMASGAAQDDWRGGHDIREGVEGSVPFRGNLSDTIKSLNLGIGSGCSYSGVNSIRDLYDNSEYVVVSSASLVESNPRI